MALTTFTLATHDLNDGTTYTVVNESLVIGSLQTTWDEYTAYPSGAAAQYNVKAGNPGHIIFDMLVQASTSALLNTAFGNLSGWIAAGGALVIADGGTNILSCTVGVNSPPDRPVSSASLLTHWLVLSVDLERLT